MKVEHGRFRLITGDDRGSPIYHTVMLWLMGSLVCLLAMIVASVLSSQLLNAVFFYTWIASPFLLGVSNVWLPLPSRIRLRCVADPLPTIEPPPRPFSPEWNRDVLDDFVQWWERLYPDAATRPPLEVPDLGTGDWVYFGGKWVHYRVEENPCRLVYSILEQPYQRRDGSIWLLPREHSNQRNPSLGWPVVYEEGATCALILRTMTLAGLVFYAWCPKCGMPNYFPKDSQQSYHCVKCHFEAPLFWPEVAS